MVQPDYLGALLGEYKIRLFMEGKVLDGNGQIVPAEPASLTPLKWNELHDDWRRRAGNFLAHCGAPGDRLPCAVNAIFEGYMRGFAYQRALRPDPMVPYALPEDPLYRAELEAHIEGVTRDLNLYTEYAVEYLQRRGGVSRERAESLIGIIIRDCIDTFMAVLPGNKPEVDRTSLPPPGPLHCR